MKFFQSIAQTPAPQLVRVARAIEAAGFDGITMSDHLVRPQDVASRYPYAAAGQMAAGTATPYPDCWVLAGALAQVTARVRFMPYVYVLPLRDPFSATKAITTAAVLTGERLMLGIGVGWMEEEFTLTGQPFARRGKRTDEMVEILRKLCSGDMEEHDGEFYDFGPLQMQPVPEHPPPILVGGHSPVALRRAARLDGWIGVNYDLPQALEHLGALLAARREAGTSDRPFEAALALNTEPDLDACRRLADAGATILVNPPLGIPNAATTPIEDKLDSLADFAERLIERA
jgi:probable F420-dependent oxidoreductase